VEIGDLVLKTNFICFYYSLLTKIPLDISFLPSQLVKERIVHCFLAFILAFILPCFLGTACQLGRVAKTSSLQARRSSPLVIQASTAKIRLRYAIGERESEAHGGERSDTFRIVLSRESKLQNNKQLTQLTILTKHKLNATKSTQQTRKYWYSVYKAHRHSSAGIRALTWNLC